MTERKHTIVLLRPNKNTRTYFEYDTVSAAMDGICKMFEKKLKELNPTMTTLSYDISDLHRYLDSLPQLVALIQDQSGSYTPHEKDWIKKRVYLHLRNQAS